MKAERFIIRAGTGCSFYYVGPGREGPVFSGAQSAAMRFGSFEKAREVLRIIITSKEGAELRDTMRPIRLAGARRIRFGAVMTGRAGS